MTGGDRMRITGQMEVNVLHWDNLSAAASRPAALDAKDWSQRRLAQRHRGALADSAQTHRQSDRGRRLTLAERGGINGGHQNIPAARFVLEALKRRETHFGFISPVRMKLVFRQAEPVSDILDWEGLIGSRNVEVGHGRMCAHCAVDRTKKIRAMSSDIARDGADARKRLSPECTSSDRRFGRSP